MKRLIIAILAASAFIAYAMQPEEKIPIIFDTDLGNDIDDAIALAMLYRYADEGKVDILAIGLSKEGEAPAICLDIFNHWYCRQDTPVGIIHNAVVCGNEDKNYALALSEMRELGGRYLYPRDISIDHNALPEAVTVYRKALAQAEDSSVVMVVVGFATNIARLLESQADEYSELSGKELVAKKVKSLIVMAGSFDGTNHSEYNVQMDVKSYQTLVAMWPTDITFVPFELGIQVLYPASSIETGYREGHPLVAAYRSFLEMPYDRPCWDPATLLYAVEGNGLFKEFRCGTVAVADDGETTFTPDRNGRHRYISVNKKHAERLSARIVSLCENYERECDRLRGKKLVTCGDSFTEGDFWNYIDSDGNENRYSPEIYDDGWNCYMTYPYWIAKRNGMQLVNMAKCGAMIGINEERDCESFVREKLYQVPEDADYVILKFGINDSWNMPLGELTDTVATTFCGAWNITLSYLMENRPAARTGVIVSNYCKSREWGEAVIALCKKYDIPCLDEESDEVPYFYGQKFKDYPQEDKDRKDASYCCSPTNGHPNVDAHKIESLVVEKFLLQVLDAG
ncbi:MAG: nucleoside hydrolase [Candidatus Cryptobacteroides sp.]